MFAIAVEKRPSRGAEISGLLCTAILGGALVPFAMGLIADAWSPRAAFVVPVICFLGLVRIARRP